MSERLAVRAEIYVWNDDLSDEWEGETRIAYGYGYTSQEACADAIDNALQQSGGAPTLRATLNDWSAA